MSVVHIDGRTVQVSDKVPWPLTIVIVSIALAIWTWVLKPLFWWFFQSLYLHTVTDHMLKQDGIPDPDRERWHVFWGMVFFLLTALVLYWAHEYWNGYLLALAFCFGSAYLFITIAYYENEEENELYPTVGGQ